MPCDKIPTEVNLGLGKVPAEPERGPGLERPEREAGGPGCRQEAHHLPSQGQGQGQLSRSGLPLCYGVTLRAWEGSRAEPESRMHIRKFWCRGASVDSESQILGLGARSPGSERDSCIPPLSAQGLGAGGHTATRNQPLFNSAFL